MFYSYFGQESEREKVTVDGSLRPSTTDTFDLIVSTLKMYVNKNFYGGAARGLRDNLLKFSGKLRII